MRSNLPHVAIDIFSDENLEDPYPAYRAIRDAGPVCHLGDTGYLAIGRHADLKRALADWQSFSSASGVALNDAVNGALQGTILASDPPRHELLRAIVGRPLTPSRLAALKERVQTEADAIVDKLVSQKQFCAATELAHHLPLTVVSDLVGLPEEGRERMLDWGTATFEAFAPESAGRLEQALPITIEMASYIADHGLIGRLAPEGWAAQLYQAVTAGEIDRPTFESLLQAYLAPSLDTTIFATSNLIWLFGQNPDQWERLRNQPALISRAINEALRTESPASGFSRLAVRDIDIDGCTIPEGSRVVMLFASGNRDERRYADPDRFDIGRDSQDHLAFGHALHKCVGMNLAILEMTALLRALLARVESFSILNERRAGNAILRGFKELQIDVKAA